MKYNIYCDESCHLENDHNDVMLLGAISCPADKVHNFSQELKQLKEEFKARGELKWTKVSDSRLDFFIKVVEFFFSKPELGFRSLIVKHKQMLDHKMFNENSHDNFYYKMYYFLLINWSIFTTENSYNIFIDIKDTRSRVKLDNLEEIICKSIKSKVVDKMQHVRSHEVELLQLSDFLLGAISYSSRNLSGSSAKLAVINRIKELSGIDINYNTPPWEEKFNLFYFSPRATK